MVEDVEFDGYLPRISFVGPKATLIGGSPCELVTRDRPLLVSVSNLESFQQFFGVFGISSA